MRIRLLHILWGGILGGMQRLVVELTRHHNPEKYDLTVAILTKSGKMTDQIDRNKIRVVEFGLSSSLDIRGFLRFFSFIRSNRFNIIHNHERTILMNLIIVALKPRPVLFYHEHGTVLLSGSYKTRLFYAIFSRYYNTFIAIHKEMADSMKRLVMVPPEKLIVIENPVDVDYFSPAIESCNNITYSKNPPTIGTVARLAPEKDLNLFIETARLVLRRFPETRFVIVGEGPLQEKLQRDCNDPELKNSIFLAGGTIDVPKLLRSFDLFLFTSRIEPFGMTLLESLACGVPVLSAKPEAGGAINLLQTLPGVTLVQKRDPHALAETVFKLLENPKELKILGRLGREYVVKYYNVKIWIEALDLLYIKLLELNNGS